MTAREAQHTIKVERAAAAAVEERAAATRISVENQRQAAAMQALVRLTSTFLLVLCCSPPI